MYTHIRSELPPIPRRDPLHLLFAVARESPPIPIRPSPPNRRVLREARSIKQNDDATLKKGFLNDAGMMDQTALRSSHSSCAGRSLI